MFSLTSRNRIRNNLSWLASPVLLFFVATAYTSVAFAERPAQYSEDLPACFEVIDMAQSHEIRSVTTAKNDPTLESALGANAKIFYLNKNGGTYLPGANDSRRNRSSLIVADSTIPSWQVGDEDWQDIVACVSEVFSPYNVFVTDLDPGGPAHIEAVVGGSYTDLNNQLQRAVGGVAPFPSDCGVVDNSVVFVFAEDALGDKRRVCEIIAHEIAHSYGLDHSFFVKTS